MVLNITNGDYFNSYFLEQLHTEYTGDALPFREAMIQGETVNEVFSNEFIRIRAKELSVEETTYRNNARNFLNFCAKHTDYQELRLWFGKDSFCQLNLLTLLATLEKIGYEGKLTLFIIDDESFEILEKDIPLQLGIYQNLYEKILVQRIPAPNATEYGIIYKRAIDLYFDYLSPDGTLAKYILKNRDKDERTLIKELLLQTKEYGLSDLNIIDLIKRIKKN